MNVSFSDLVQSQAYDVHATAVAKANCTVATVTAILIMIFADWGFGFWWILIVPGLWFVASLLVAMPFVLLQLAIAVALQRDPMKSRRITSTIDLINYIVLVFGVYYGLEYIHDLIA